MEVGDPPTREAPLRLELPVDGASVREQVRAGGVAAIKVGGELDLGSVFRFQEALDRAGEERRALVVDMRELEFMDSSGLRALLGASEGLRAERLSLGVVVGDPSPVRRLVSLAGVDHCLALFTSPEQALPFVDEGRR